jgi:hypothetical protein
MLLVDAVLGHIADTSSSSSRRLPPLIFFA